MPSTSPPSPPYLGPATWHGGNDNKPIHRIVMHATDGSEPGVTGAARATVAYSKATTRPSSFHYVADSRESLQYVYDGTEAYHAPPNQHSLGYELCCSLSNEGKGHWVDADHQRMLKIAALDVAHLCLAYGVPIVKLTVDDLKAGKHGICGHVDVSNAWHETSHWDPGPYFPWDQFIAMVKEEAHKLIGHHGRRVATLNIQSVPLMSLDKVRADVRKASHLADVILWQEIQPEGYKTVVASLAQHGFQTEHLDTECPISYRTDSWEKVDAGKIKTHGGLPKVSPYRVVTWVRLRHRSTSAVITFVNTHMVSGGWSHRSVFQRAWRRHMWKRHFRKQSKLITHLVQDHGDTVVGGGDHNRANIPKFIPTQMWISSAGIDDLYYVPGPRAKVGVEQHDTVPGFNSDHDMRRGFLTIERV